MQYLFIEDYISLLQALEISPILDILKGNGRLQTYHLKTGFMLA